MTVTWWIPSRGHDYFVPFFFLGFWFLGITLPLLAQTETGQAASRGLPWSRFLSWLKMVDFYTEAEERASFMQLSHSILLPRALVQYITVAIGMCEKIVNSPSSITCLISY